MTIPTVGEMINNWGQVKEWKRWLLCLFPIVALYLIGWATTISLFFPIAYLKAADYLIIFPGIVSIFALHAGIALFVPRGKDIISGIICFLMFLTLIMVWQGNGMPIWIAAYYLFAHIISFWAVCQKFKRGKGAITQLYGLIISAIGYILMIMSGLVAFGFIWDAVEAVLGGWLVWLLFWFVFPIGALIAPIYEGLANGFWMPALFVWVFPILSAIIIAFGQWIISSSDDADFIEGKVIHGKSDE